MFQPKIKYVASGQYLVAKSEPLILQAILGTCVGVAVYDTKNRVGGLLHLLLPEPVSLHMTGQPERYASTGLPLFLDALYKSGAKKDSMRVVIAGGALVGPINEQDLALDIGGKTSEIVKNILDRHHLNIEASETGGVFTCSLILDMAKWKVKIEPSYNARIHSNAALPPPDRAKVVKAIDKILPIPQVALKVLRIIHNDDYCTPAIAKEIKKDQVLSAKTLAICNSAMFGLRHRLESLEDALVLLGRNRFVQMVLSEAVKNYFNQTDFGYSLCKGGLYHHAVGTATITEKIASSHTPGSFSSMAYIAGLMHDIGKVVLDQHISCTYPYLYRLENNESMNMIEIERQAFDIDHCEVGALLAEKWGLPDIFVDTIRHHHQPDQSTSGSNLPHMVYLADIIMSQFQACLEIERVNLSQLSSALVKTGLQLAQFPSLVDLVPDQMVNAFED
jgi:putative nucleotidyltransferase with HDIG domain